MTISNFWIILFSVYLFIILTVDLRRYIIKKKTKYYQGISIIAILIIIYFGKFSGSYSPILAKMNRETFNIPKIEESMELFGRSKFKEEWINKDIANIQHAKKIITIGNNIEKELDFFINYKDSVTIVEQTIFPVFSDSVKKKYYLYKRIEDDRMMLNFEKVVLNKEQKDKILKLWKL